MQVDPPFYLHTMDPGGTTGLLLMRIEPDDFTVTEQRTERYRPDLAESPVKILQGWTERYDDLPHVLVYENFHIRPGRKNTDTTALRILADLEGWLAPGDEDTAKLAQAIRLLQGLSPLLFKIADGADLLNRGMQLLREAGAPVDTEPTRPQSGPYRRVIAQEPVEAKSIVTDAVLHRLGLKTFGPGSVHINDAARHGAAWLASQRYLPLCRQGWPQRAAAS